MKLGICPFCKSKDLFYTEIIGANSSRFCVMCNSCEASGPRRGTKRAAAKAWNIPSRVSIELDVKDLLRIKAT